MFSSGTDPTRQAFTIFLADFSPQINTNWNGGNYAQKPWWATVSPNQGDRDNTVAGNRFDGCSGSHRAGSRF
ncbi:MAG: hypothetical protein Fur0021_31220 [Candidatus Promineifilaceae bacterium]